MSKNFWKWPFLIGCLLVAVLHLIGIIECDEIFVGLVLIGILPFLIPYLSRSFKSVEAFGLKFEARVSELEGLVSEQELKLRQHQEKINRLVKNSLADYLVEMLINFERCENGRMKEYLYFLSAEAAIRQLRDRAFIQKTFNLSQLKERENIAPLVKLTDEGRDFLELRRESQNDVSGFHRN